MDNQITLVLRPNNQITLTRGTWRKKDSLVSQSIHTDNYRFTDEALAEEKEKLAIASALAKIASPYQKKRVAEELDIIKKSQRKLKMDAKRPNTPKNFTRKSGQRIRECGGAMNIACAGEMRFCHEVTLTLAGNRPEIFAALASNTGYAINRLFQPIRRKYGEMCHWFFVWEYQKRGALHIHIALYHPDESEGLFISALLIEQWEKILLDIGKMENICMFTSKKKDRCTIKQNHQNHCQPITKNVGAYFSKYAGKEESKNNWYCQKYPVSRFWGSSKQIKETIKANSRKLEFDYQSNTKEADKKYQEIIEELINELEIIEAKSYDFCIKLDKKSRLNRCKDGKKYLSVDDGKYIARGTRETFYIPQEFFKKCTDIFDKLNAF